MPEPLSLPPDAVIAGYDFSTGGVKALAFDLAGNTVAAAPRPELIHPGVLRYLREIGVVR